MRSNRSHCPLVRLQGSRALAGFLAVRLSHGTLSDCQYRWGALTACIGLSLSLPMPPLTAPWPSVVQVVNALAAYPNNLSIITLAGRTYTDHQSLPPRPAKSAATSPKR